MKQKKGIGTPGILIFGWSWNHGAGESVGFR